jgi:nucleoid-associated protein YgaU
VRRGDTYWSIAGRLLGDPKRYPELQAASQPAHVLRAGETIAVPHPGGEFVYVVPRGGTFWAAARAAYGHPSAELVSTVVQWNGGVAERPLAVGERLYCPLGT